VLLYCGAFRKLDDLLCPIGDSLAREHCGGDYKLSEAILLKSGFESSDLADVFDVLRSRGGFCDCEILYNVAETSRLKSAYWHNRGQGSPRHAKELEKLRDRGLAIAHAGLRKNSGKEGQKDK